ncbi:MAG TPA: hypothetical protein VMD08_16955, partial [Candidatus Baltobacteraceae bacterium]|nr:hypothetical protein [Candidatus Baltobacteraceae bacterium]
LRRAMRQALRGAATASGLACVGLFVSRIGLETGPMALWVCLVAAGYVLAFLGGFHRVPVLHAARLLDAHFGLGERLVTAAESFGQPGLMPQLMLRDAARRAAQVDVRRLPADPLGRETLLLILALIAGAVLWSLQPDSPAASARVTQQAGSPDAVAGETPAASASATPPRSRPGLEQQRSSGALRRALGGDAARVAFDQALPAPDPKPTNSGERAAPGGQAPQESGVGHTRTSSTGEGGQDPSPTGRVPSRVPDSDRGASRVAHFHRDPATNDLPGSGGAAQPSGQALSPAHAAGAGSAISGHGSQSTAGVSDPGQEARARSTIRPSLDPPSEATPAAAVPAPAASASGAFLRTGVPPALRDYVLRYFHALQASPRQEDPS